MHELHVFVCCREWRCFIFRGAGADISTRVLVRKVHRAAPTSVKLMEVRSIAATLSVKDPSMLEENVVRIKRNVHLQDAQRKVVESTVSVRNTSHRNTSYREHLSPLL